MTNIAIVALVPSHFRGDNLLIIPEAKGIRLYRQRDATFPTAEAAIEAGFLGAERGAWLLHNGEWDPNEWIGLAKEEEEEEEVENGFGD